MLMIAALLALAPSTRSALLKRAERGEVRAEVQLALSLQDEKQGPVDLAASEHWLRVAAATGDAEGECWLGRLLHLVPKAHHDPIEARYWYQKAVDQGNARAMNNLGVLYLKGDGVRLDERKAGALFKASADRGDSFGERNYADWLVDHPSLHRGNEPSTHWEVDVPRVLGLYQKAAAQGDTVSMMKLASCYKRGNPLGLPESAVHYAEWTRLAAESGATDAMVSLGWAYEHGYGVPKDGSQSVAWTQRAAEAGHLQAMTNLGILYSQGRVVPKDEATSIKWFERGDASGSWTSTYELAIRYRIGEGVARNPGEAARLFRKAAGFGWGEAWLGLGRLYEEGAGVSKDPAQALACYFMGARRWNAMSENNLGAYYEHGVAGTTDLSLAWCWFTISKKEGCDLAARNLFSLEDRMGFLDKIRAARELPRIETWLEQARSEEKKRLDEMLPWHS